ncbi:phage coat protein [Peptostreptococcus faecalis]|uniref:phage coat protein n=1 Tax=Peptostreptococcus faecalis TaxID=2045015 RepID=UPI000C7A0AB0|nr:phage coat protein [Peptostreptococcus faecalis]
MTTVFNGKIFNEEAFGQYVNSLPQVTKTELLKSGAVASNQDIYNLFQGQVNSYYGRIPMYGTIGGEALNYDGMTDIGADSINTYDRGVLAYGRAKAWTEKDFSYDVTSGVDFISQIGKQVSSYWEKIDQATLLSVLNGVFSMSAPKQNKEFVDNHTLVVDGKIQEDTLNNAIQQACGDNKNIFSLVIMHSQVATNLENLNLMKRWTQTDANGLTRELTLGTWNGKTVLVDDSMPVNTTTISEPSGEEGGAPSKKSITQYTTYVLGSGAIEFGELPVKVAYEVDRNPSKNGGQDYLYSRKRNYIAPYGISYEKKNQASLSPTNKELENPSNWTLVNDGNGEYISHKAIPMARIVSQG